MKDFSGKVAVVTGAASGIGRAMAERFAREGMKVVLADVEEGALAQADAEMREKGATVLPVRADVSKSADVEALAQQTLDAFGAVHVVCNNAGVGAQSGAVWEAPIQDWQWVLGVNLWGVIHGVRTFVPIMLQQDTEGHIVNTASMAGLIASPYLGIYTVTKFGVVGLSESLHHELTMRGSKLRVSVLCPSWVNTRIIDAERNRPPELSAGGAVHPMFAAMEPAVRQMLQSGLPPDTVAEHVFQAVHDERFYILTHPETKDFVRERTERILAGETPVFRGFS